MASRLMSMVAFSFVLAFVAMSATAYRRRRRAVK
jgi:hypothetical protein